MSNGNDIVIKILTDIKQSLSAIDQLKDAEDEFVQTTEDGLNSVQDDFNKVIPEAAFEKTKQVMGEFSREAIGNFDKVQTLLDNLNSDEAQAEFLELAVSNNQMTQEMLEDYLKIQTATGELAEEAVEDFLKVHRSMEMIDVGASNVGGRMNAMGMQFSYALNDLPMMLLDIRMGMMGIANNIQPMLMQAQQLKAEGMSTMAIMKGLSGTLMGPAGIITGITLATMVIPKLVEWLKKDKESSEDAAKAHEEYVQSLEGIRGITAADEAQKQIELIDKQNDLYNEQINIYSDLEISAKKLQEQQENVGKRGNFSLRAPFKATREEIILSEQEFEKLNEIAVRFGLNVNDVADSQKLIKILTDEQTRLSSELLQNDNKRKLLLIQKKDLEEIATAKDEKELAIKTKIVALQREITELKAFGFNEAFTDEELEQFKKADDYLKSIGEVETQNLTAVQNIAAGIGDNLAYAVLNGQNFGEAVLNSLEAIAAKVLSMSAVWALLQLLPGGNAFTGGFTSFLGSVFGFGLSKGTMSKAVSGSYSGLGKANIVVDGSTIPMVAVVDGKKLILATEAAMEDIL